MEIFVDKSKDSVSTDINYTSKLEYDAAAFFCPYIPLQVSSVCKARPRQCYE
jgi:hypothetical protein